MGKAIEQKGKIQDMICSKDERNLGTSKSLNELHRIEPSRSGEIFCNEERFLHLYLGREMGVIYLLEFQHKWPRGSAPHVMHAISFYVRSFPSVGGFVNNKVLD